MRFRILRAAIALGAALPAPASALTLGECLALARAHAPALEAATADMSRARGVVGEARAAGHPTLRLDASYLQNSEAPKQVFDLPGLPPAQGHQVIDLGTANTLDVRTQARYTLYSGGRNGALVRAAQAGVSAEESAHGQADADLALRVAQAFYREASAARLVQASEEALASARVHLGVAQARVNAGIVPKLDALRADVDATAREITLVRAQEARRMARADLEATIGVPLDAGDTLVVPEPDVAAPPDSSRALADAIAARPEIAALDRQIEQARHQVVAARAGRRPQVSLAGTAEYRGPNKNRDYLDFDDPGLKTYNLSAALELGLPIFDGGLTSSRVSQRQAEQAALEARRRGAALTVEREVRQAFSDLRIAVVEWQSNEARLRSAREATRLAEAAYKGGTGTATDVRDAETALADARAEQARSLMDYWSARAALDHATGRLSTERER